MNRLTPWISLAVVVVITLFVFFGKGDAAVRLNQAITYAAIMIVLLFSLVVVVAIATGEIQISALLSEAGGGASMSRFQLLIFTLVIALCFVLIVIAHNNQFPKIPNEVLELLGVSASTYAVSKGIQAGGDLKSKIAPAGSPEKKD